MDTFPYLDWTWNNFISSCCRVAAARTAAQICTAQLEVLHRLLRANGTPSSQGLLHPQGWKSYGRYRTIWKWNDMNFMNHLWTIQIRSVCTTVQRILIILGKLQWLSLSRSLRTCLVWTGFCSHTAGIWQSSAGLLPVSVAAILRFASILILSHSTFCKCTDQNIRKWLCLASLSLPPAFFVTSLGNSHSPVQTVVGQVLSNADVVNDAFWEMLCTIDIKFANNSLASKQARNSNLVKTRWFPPDRNKDACKRNGLMWKDTGHNCMSSSLSLARSRLVLPGCSRNHVIAGH